MGSFFPDLSSHSYHAPTGCCTPGQPLARLLPSTPCRRPLHLQKFLSIRTFKAPRGALLGSRRQGPRMDATSTMCPEREKGGKAKGAHK
jgi:hypothetical protein